MCCFAFSVLYFSLRESASSVFNIRVFRTFLRERHPVVDLLYNTAESSFLIQQNDEQPQARSLKKRGEPPRQEITSVFSPSLAQLCQRKIMDVA